MALGSALVISCKSGPGPAALPPSELTVGQEGSPGSLDPRIAQDAYSTRILPLIYEGLFELAPNAEPKPRLAESWTHPDPLAYTFVLRRGHYFPDGSELTAEDVAATFKSLADPGLGSPRKVIMDQIAELSVPDRYTLKVRLKEPYAPFLTDLCQGIVPPAAIQDAAEFGKRPLGSGPYQVESYEPGSEVVLIINPRYAGPRPALSRIVFKAVPDDVTRVMALERGEISLLLNAIGPDDLPLLQKNPQLRVIVQPGINYNYLGMNLSDPILKKREVREAIAYALDRQKIASCLLRDTVTPANGILAPSNWAYNPQVPEYQYDPARAKALLDQAGYPDPDGDGPKPRFHLAYKTSENKVRRWVAEAVSDQLRQVGIDVTVRSYEFGTFFADIRAGNFQIYSLTWVGITEPDIYYLAFNSRSLPPHGANRGRYVSPEMDRLTELGRAATDRDQRRRIYAEAQELAGRDLPYISLWYTKDIVVMPKRLRGFVIYPGGDYRSLAETGWEKDY